MLCSVLACEQAPTSVRCSSSRLRSVAKFDACTATTRPRPLTSVTAKRVRVRGSNQLRYACEAWGCSATFERLITLNLHLKTHTVSDVYSRYCTKFISSNYNAFFCVCHDLAVARLVVVCAKYTHCITLCAYMVRTAAVFDVAAPVLIAECMHACLLCALQAQDARGTDSCMAGSSSNETAAV
jgi:hypothetical protein